MNTHTPEEKTVKHHETGIKENVDVVVHEVPIYSFNKTQLVKYGAVAICASVAIGAGAALATPMVVAYFAPVPVTGMAALWAKLKFF